MRAVLDAKKTLDMMEAELSSFVQTEDTSINKEILEVFIDSFLMEIGNSDTFLRDFEFVK